MVIFKESESLVGGAGLHWFEGRLFWGMGAEARVRRRRDWRSLLEEVLLLKVANDIQIVLHKSNSL